MMRDRSILLTGATSGSGLETARSLARQGATLILACRNLEQAYFVQQHPRRVAKLATDRRLPALLRIYRASLRRVAKLATDRRLQRDLWRVSAELTGAIVDF